MNMITTVNLKLLEITESFDEKKNNPGQFLIEWCAHAVKAAPITYTSNGQKKISVILGSSAISRNTLRNAFDRQNWSRDHRN